MAEITIVTPVLNQADTIEACIKSVAAQNVDVEYLVMDGGSSDGTIEIIRDNQHLISFWNSEPDSGQSEAINKGLKRATGTFFNWLNADDILTDNALAHLLASEKPDTDIFVGRCMHITDDKSELETGTARIWESVEQTLGNYSMAQPSVFYKTEIIRNLGGLNQDLHLCMDMDLWFRYLLKFGQNSILTTDKILSKFLVSEKSKSSSQKTEMTIEKYGLYRSLFENYELPDILRSFLHQFQIPASITYNPPKHFDPEKLIANFCWHLMVDAYDKRNLAECQKWYPLVNRKGRLSNSEKLGWKARFATAKALGNE